MSDIFNGLSSNSFKKNAWLILTVAVGAFILLLPTFYNGYPLLTPDSTQYIGCGMEHYMNKFRPITYSIFIRYTSFNSSLWYTAFIQAVLLAFLLIKTVQIISKKTTPGKFFLILFSLIAFTSVGWNVGQITPDIFMAIGFLSLFILLFQKRRSWFETIFLSLLIILSILVHKSHHLVLILISSLILILKLLNTNYYLVSHQHKTTILGVFILIQSGWILYPAMNYYWSGSFNNAPFSSEAFLMARMADNGMLVRVLDEICDENNDYALCQYRDSLFLHHQFFLWNQQSPFNKTGGIGNREENKEIILKSLSTPKLLFHHVIEGVKGTFEQITYFKTGWLLWNQSGNKSLHNLIKTHFRYEYNEFKHSRLNNSTIQFETWNKLYYFVITGSLLIIFYWLLFNHKKSSVYKTILYCIFLLIIFNALVVGVLSGASPRYQDRIIWLIPMLIIVKMISEKSVMVKKKNIEEPI